MSDRARADEPEGSATRATRGAEAPAASAEGNGDAEAQQLFVAGRAAYGDARYDQALALFRRAYELSHRAGLLYNIGQAADRLRLVDDTIAAFEAYLEAEPAAPNALEVETRLEVLRRARAERRRVEAQATAAREDVDARSDDALIVGLAIAGGVLVVAGIAVAIGFAVYDPGTAAPPRGDVGTDGVVSALSMSF